MGNICSCLLGAGNGNSAEDEALLAAQQNNYGSQREHYNNIDEETLLQNKRREEEERLNRRIENLRQIVENTNDKLIDISMINNSGIVQPGYDGSKSDGESEATTKKKGPLDIKESISFVLENIDRPVDDTLCETIYSEIQEQIKMDTPPSLTVKLQSQ